MGLEDFLISTGVDALIKLVHSKGKIEIKDAARALKMPVSTIEDWARTLESEGLVKIQYQLTKEYLVWAGFGKEEYGKRREDVEVRKDETLRKLEGLKKTVDQNVEEISDLEQQFEGVKQKNEQEIDLIAGDYREASQLLIQAQNSID
ncbi:MAG: hypothetical protein ABIH83_03725 [Candidatus Micrarchaeota archaeon]